MTRPIHHVVYDCVVFAQALISPDGPSGKCVDHARDGTVRLFISDYIVTEIRELEGKIPAKYGVTREQINELADEVSLFGVFVSNVPSVYRHLLNLMDDRRSEGKEFRRPFPKVIVLPPDIFAARLRAEKKSG